MMTNNEDDDVAFIPQLLQIVKFFHIKLSSIKGGGGSLNWDRGLRMTQQSFFVFRQKFKL